MGESTTKLSPIRIPKLLCEFNPDLYDPRSWASAARKAGMKYVVLTTKHHEGFACGIANSPITRSPIPPMAKTLHPYVDAFRAEGLKVGVYLSSSTGITAIPHRWSAPLRDDPAAITLNQQRDMGNM